MLSTQFIRSWIITFEIMYVVGQAPPELSPFNLISTINGSDVKLQCLNNISGISKLNSSMTTLCIENSYLPQIEEGTFSDLPNLKTLVLNNVSLTEVLPNSFTKLPNLKYVDLTDNRIKNLSPSTFQSNQKLEGLSLKRNNVSEVKSIISTLIFSPSFHHLDLSGNNIKEFEHRGIKLPNLRVLKLKECRLTSFSSSSLPTLNELYLGNNHLTSESVDLSGFNNSGTLKELHLGNADTEQAAGSSVVYNYFPEIKSNFFPCLPKLLLLDLQSCDITSIHSSAFNTVPRLETLILRSNNLPTIPTSVTILRSLRTLDMSYNGKKAVAFELKHGTFTMMQSLKYLNLSFNKLLYLPSKSFYGLTNLTSLSLSNTELTKIEPYAFRTLTSLRYLDLSNNHLATLINNTLADLVSLTHLKIFSNALKIYIEDHPFLPTISLEVLEFQHNSLCELRGYLISHLSNLTYLDMSHNKIIEWRWNAFPNSGNLKMANFEDNEIQVMTPPMVNNLLMLESGLFSNNPYNCTDCEIVNVQELLKSPRYSQYKNEYRCRYKYRENEDFVFNATLPSSCYDSSLHYVGVGIGTGFLFIFILVLSFVAYHFRWYIRYRWFVAQCHLKTWHNPLQRKQSYLYDAFISYSDKDRYWVKNEFLPRLESDFNFHFCVHERDFVPGRNITDNIFEGIDKSKMFIAILTESFLISRWCIWEMNMAISKMAIEQKNNLVIIKLHTISRDKLTRSIQYLMKTKTYLSWPVTPTGQRLFWERMVHILHKYTGATNSESSANPV